MLNVKEFNQLPLTDDEGYLLVKIQFTENRILRLKEILDRKVKNSNNYHKLRIKIQKREDKLEGQRKAFLVSLSKRGYRNTHILAHQWGWSN